MNRLTPQDIEKCISTLISRNKLWAGKNVQIYFIANITAGCFTNKKKTKYYKILFNKTEADSLKSPACTSSVITKIFNTEYTGHAKDLADAVVTELIATFRPETECVLVTAGGDGTSLEVQTALYLAAQREPRKKEMIMNHITLLRLPLGTGNDGTDGHSIEETLEILRNAVTFTNAKALKIYTEGKHSEDDIKRLGKDPAKYNTIKTPSPWYCFNIVSMGLDAYVVYMTNTVKRKFPGNFYHLCVPLSGLVYNKDFPMGTATVEFFDENDSKVDELTEPITLIAVGASGNRVYGGGHKVLPNENNVCIAPKITLARLIRDNHQFVDGSFVGTDLASLHSAEKIRINYDKAILVQADGEVVMLCKEDFPLVVEKTAPCIRIISSRTQA